MSEKHDWKATDDLLAQLRAKVEEDAAPQENESAAAVGSAPEKEPVSPGEPTLEEGSAPAKTPDPAGAPDPSLNAAKESSAPSGKKRSRRAKARDTEGGELAWIDRKPAGDPHATPPENAKKAPVEKAGEKSTPAGPQPTAATGKGTRTSGGEGRSSGAKSARSAAPKRATTARRATTHIPSPGSRTASVDDIANLTVESLMSDIFGAAKDKDGHNWFEDGKAVFDREENSPTDTAKEHTEEPPAPPTGSGIEERLAPNSPATVVKGKDGQMAFVLPQTGRAQTEAEPIAGTETSAEPPAFDEKHLFSAFAIEQRGGTAPEPQPESDHAEKQALKEEVESSDEDLQLLLDLDYEDELGNAIGFEKILAYRELGVNGAALQRRRRYRADERREFETRGQDIRLRKEYAKQKKGNILRLSFSLGLLLFIFFYEHPTWFPLLFRGPLDSVDFPRSYILIGIQLLVIDAALAYRRLWKGLVAFFHLKPTDYSLCSVMVFVTFLYHLILIFLPADGAPALYLSPAAAAMSLLLCSDLLDWYRESMAFRVVSSRKQKYALIARVSVGGKQNNARARLMEQEQDERVWYVRPVKFVRNYFSNTDKRVEHNRSLGVQLLLAAAVGIACGLYVLACGEKGSVMLQTVLITLLLCMPVISMLVTSVPMFLAAVLCLGKTGAIIGEEPVYSSGEKTTLVLPENEVFEAMNHEQFECVEDCDIQRTLILVRALLERVQSPLVDSVDVDAELRIPGENVTLTDICEDGVAASVGEEQTGMLMGSVAYLQRAGIPVKLRDHADSGEIYKRMLLVAIDGKVCAVFLARYRFSGKMEQLLAQLRGEDVRVMVRTRDPGIHNGLLAALQPDEKEPMRVMKPTAAEVDILTDRVDATIVALGSCHAVCETFLVCRRIRRAGILGKFLQGLSIAVGALIAVLISVFGQVSTLSPALITLYIIFWCAADGVASYLYLREKEHS